MHDKGFYHGNNWSEGTGKDLDCENSFDFDSYNTMTTRSKNLISAVSHNVIVRRTKNNHEKHFNEHETSLSMRSLLEERLLLTTMTNILDVALNLLKSYNGSVPDKCLGLTVESWANMFPVIKSVTHICK